MGDETVSLPLFTAKQILQTLTSAFYFSQVHDLSDSYRELKTDNFKWSKMTQELMRQIDELTRYIEEVENVEQPDDGEPAREDSD